MLSVVNNDADLEVGHLGQFVGLLHQLLLSLALHVQDAFSLGPLDSGTTLLHSTSLIHTYIVKYNLQIIIIN